MFSEMGASRFEYKILDILHEFWNNEGLGDKPEFYIHVIKKISELAIIGNMNDNKDFEEFVVKSIRLSYITDFVPIRDYPILESIDDNGA